MAEPETPQPAAPSESGTKKPYHGSGPGGYSWKWILLAALGVYALLLIIQNSKHVSVSFVFFSQKTRVIYLVLLCVALGALITWLVPRMRQRRKKKRRSSSAGGDAKGTGPGGISWKAILLGALGIYALLLIILNRKSVRLDFVFFSERTRLIFLVLLSMALGALIMLVVSRMRKDRQKRASSAPAAPPGDDTPPAGTGTSTG